MPKPFYQGKVDTFCAIYAVLNSFRLIFGMRTLKARDIFNTTLLSMCTRPAAFSRVLTMDTDYISLVDEMLDTQSLLLPFRLERPWGPKDTPSADEVWAKAEEWLGGQREGVKRRALIFRFMRHIRPDKPPANRHWTCADWVDGDTLHLFDSSHDAEAILNIKRNSFCSDLASVDQEHLLYIQPESCRFLELKA